MNDGFLLEKKVMDKFKKLGWNVKPNDSFVLRDGKVRIMPDIVLEYDEIPKGIVEVKGLKDLKYKNALLQVKSIIQRFKPEYLYFTNGEVFDLYVYGEFVGCFISPLTPEDTKVFLEDK